MKIQIRALTQRKTGLDFQKEGTSMRKLAVISLTILNIMTTLVIFFVLHIMFTLTRIADSETYQGQSYVVLYGTVVLLILIGIGIWIDYYQLVVNIDPRWYWFYIILGICLLIFTYLSPFFGFFSVLYLMVGFLFYIEDKQ